MRAGPSLRQFAPPCGKPTAPGTGTQPPHPNSGDSQRQPDPPGFRLPLDFFHIPRRVEASTSVAGIDDNVRVVRKTGREHAHRVLVLVVLFRVRVNL